MYMHQPVALPHIHNGVALKAFSLDIASIAKLITVLHYIPRQCSIDMDRKGMLWQTPQESGSLIHDITLPRSTALQIYNWQQNKISTSSHSQGVGNEMRYSLNCSSEFSITSTITMMRKHRIQYPVYLHTKTMYLRSMHIQCMAFQVTVILDRC